MPTYGYECALCKEQFEVTQRMSDPALTTHDGCGGDLRRLLYPVGIVFKGPGFYVNDYAKKTGTGPTPATTDTAPKSEAPAASTDSAPKPAETAPAAPSAPAPSPSPAASPAAKAAAP